MNDYINHLTASNTKFTNLLNNKFGRNHKDNLVQALDGFIKFIPT